MNSDEQTQRILELENRIQELDVDIRNRNDFLSIAAHELRTPLTAIKLKFQLGVKLLEATRDNPLEPAAMLKLFKDGDRQMTKLSRLIDNLLDLSRIDSKQLELNIEPTNLSELLQDALERFSAQFEHSKTTITTDFSESLKGAWDRDRLDQVISNMFTNVLRYAPGSAVLVSAEDTGEAITLIIEDTGPGIAPSSRAQIFERYQKGENNLGQVGLGLGLYITKEIIHAHGGTIEVEPVIPTGARFVIRLPQVVNSPQAF